MDLRTDETKAAFFKCHRLLQQRMREMKDAWMIRKVADIQGQICGDLIQTYNIVRGHECALELADFFELARTEHLRGHPFKLPSKLVHMDVCQNAFSQRGFGAWNGLPNKFSNFELSIRNILQVALFRILKYDFPSRFPLFVELVAGYLNSANFIEFHGSLLSVYSLVQAFDRQANDKDALSGAMNTVLPHIYERMGVLMSDTSDESLSLQKLVLKIFYRYTEYYLPTDSINEQSVMLTVSIFIFRQKFLQKLFPISLPPVYASLHNPADAACTFISDACSKRKGILDKSMQYCIQVLSSDAKPEAKDGVLNLVGTVCDTLLKNKTYKNQLESFLITHVLPLFDAPEGYRRARACWLLGKLSRAEFGNTSLLCQAAEATRRLMCFDTDLPVRVSAANTVFALIRDQDETRKVMLSHLPDLVMQLIKLLRETEFDDLNSVLREIMIHYTTEIQPVAIHMLQELSATFVKLVGVAENGDASETNAAGDVEYNEEKEYQCLVATGVMENIETLMQVMEEQEELIASAEPVIIQLVQIILKHNVTDFYDEAFSLICSLTCTKISPLMWSVFDWLYEAYEKDAEDCFASMMPTLHNYVTVDPKGFISAPHRVEMLISMCTKSLDSDEDESNEAVHAAKMLEVLIINFRGQMDAVIPKFVELALTKLTQSSTNVELRMICLQVVIAAIVSSRSIVLPILSTHNWPGTETPIIENFLRIWLENISRFTGLHDRRVCVLGLCTLLSLRDEERPPAVNKLSTQYLPALLLLLNGLKDAYALKAQEENEDDDDEDDDDDDDDDDDEDQAEEALESDEDVIDEEGARYLELLEAVEADASDSDDDDDDFDADSVLEEFDTDLDKDECKMDEYVTFYQLMTDMEQSHPGWYQQLVAPLSEAQKTEFKNIAETALKCIHQKQSKEIEKAGGYSFQQTDVPSSFDFSGNPPPGV
ncbi:unnamed protein product [Schistocephalus solidus]|uniref:Importin-11 n=1 Tax=Schistocephalus solidus TaxID=70667 RepID=A0A183S756_SCHSO|nr:unnamed protein product [Schistocephalus solidus]